MAAPIDRIKVHWTQYAYTFLQDRLAYNVYNQYTTVLYNSELLP